MYPLNTNTVTGFLSSPAHLAIAVPPIAPAAIVNVPAPTAPNPIAVPAEPTAATVAATPGIANPPEPTANTFHLQLYHQSLLL